MRQATVTVTPSAAAPATVTGEVPDATGPRAREGGRPSGRRPDIRKPGDLPAHGRTGGRGVPRPGKGRMPHALSAGPSPCRHMQGRRRNDAPARLLSAPPAAPGASAPRRRRARARACMTPCRQRCARGVTVRGWNACRPATRAARSFAGGPERWTYVYGRLDPDRMSTTSLKARPPMPSARWHRPVARTPRSFRKQCLARIPPLKD